MKYQETRRGRAGYGQAIGILMLADMEPFIPGDVGNANTYSYPVRFKVVEGLTFERLKNKDESLLPLLIKAGQELVNEGVRAITGDCGFFVLFQKELADALEVPVFMSSLLQIPWIYPMLKREEKIGIVTTDSSKLDDAFLRAAGVSSSIPIVLKGMQGRENFMAIGQRGFVDSEKVEQEVVAAARELVAEDPMVRCLLLECSMMPPYGAAVQEAVNLPVFDYISMIDYVFSGVVKKRYIGFM